MVLREEPSVRVTSLLPSTSLLTMRLDLPLDPRVPDVVAIPRVAVRVERVIASFATGSRSPRPPPLATDRGETGERRSKGRFA